MSDESTSYTDYQQEIENKLTDSLAVAEEARSKRGDPTPEVEMNFADDLAERCEELLGIDGLAEEIRRLEDEGYDRETTALKLAEEFAAGTIGSSDEREQQIDDAVRTAVAILTEAVVAAPIEGIDGVDIQENDDGTEFIRIHYAGPIRSAGGTAQALSVLVADYIRQEFGMSKFKPRDNEVERYIEEIKLYDSENGMQYLPGDDEIRTIVRHLPILVDAEQVTDREVGGYRDLERIEGNRARGGMCLVLCEGVGLKAAKLQKYTDQLDLGGWDWLAELPNSAGGADDGDDDEEEGEEEDEADADGGDDSEQTTKKEFKPKKKYIKDLTAGRPIFSHPQANGGFRLRYGRARNTGLAASGIHPATMWLVGQFIATGTQLKTERPGKAQGASPVDGIEGPTVRLHNGTVKRIDDLQEAKELEEQVEEIIDLGEMAVPFGEFLENNHDLPQGSYVHDWWAKQAEANGLQASNLPKERINPMQSINMAKKYDIPLHPKYTYLWHDITPEQYTTLATAVENATETENGIEITTNTETDEQDGTPPVNTTLEHLLVPHKQNDGQTHIDSEHTTILQHCLDTEATGETTLEKVNNTTDFTVMKRAPMRIGARMARPEKAKQREQNPAINGLVPVGREGGTQRNILEAADYEANANNRLDGKAVEKGLDKGTIHADLSQRKCPTCDTVTWKNQCPDCTNTRTKPFAVCNRCATEVTVSGQQDCPECGEEVSSWSESPFNIRQVLNDALNNVNQRKSQFDVIKGVQGLFSNTKVVEPMEKAILRAKHDLSIYDDGTVRYDMSDLPLTAFKPNEISAPLETLKELGYTHDINGNPLENETQTVELRMQDVVVNDDAGETLLDIANFIDDLLVHYYDMEPYYNADTKEDLIGELLIGLAPHTSAGVVARLIGFTDASVGYAHPFFHAAKRRNCFHPDETLNYKLNGEWHETTIQELVETHLTDNADDSYTDGSIVQHIEDHPEIEELKVPSMTDDGYRTLEPVTALSKHEPTEQMVTLEFDDGKELTVTPDHKIPVKPDSGNKTFEEKEAKNINPRDTLYDYNEDLLNSVKNYPEIDTLEHIITDNTINHEDVMLRGLDKEDLYDLFIDALKEDWENGEFSKLQSTADYLEMSKKTLSNYLYRESFPLSIILELYDGHKEALVDEIPRNITLGVKRDNTQMPRFVNLDEELATLLGYYTAEGFTRHTQDDTRGKNATGVRQVDFAATEDQARNFIENTLKKKFNVENPYKENKRITASGTMITYFFDEIVNAGRFAHTKEVPELIKNADERLKGAYLSGYISGDGSTSSNCLRMTTVSPQLRDDLVTLIESMDYVATRKEVSPQYLRDAFPDFYDEDDDSTGKDAWRIRLEDYNEFISKNGIQLMRKQGSIKRDYETKDVLEVKTEEVSLENTYNITTRNGGLEINNSHSFQCDGDEDSVMLLMDGLVNYSEEYLNHDRRGWSMDRPLVMTTHVDPGEIDDEAHNVETVREFSLEFYTATVENKHPKEVLDEVEIGEDHIEDELVEGFNHAIETSSIDAGPVNSAYKTLGDMEEKTGEQLRVARLIRASDVDDVAMKVVDSHFIPDLMGNLAAFGRQDVRCTNCNTKYGRPPLRDMCTNCGQESLILTVHEGSVTKYLDLSLEMSQKYEFKPYLAQRLEEIEQKINSLFEDDKEKQTGLSDFM